MKLINILFVRTSISFINFKNSLTYLPKKPSFKNCSSFWKRCHKNSSNYLTKLHIITFTIPIVHAKPLIHEKRVNIFEKERLIEASKTGLINKLQYYFWNVWDISQTFIRTICLTIYFTPLFLLWPLTLLNDGIKKSWYQLLVTVLEFSGPIFIKLGQWASMRRDLFNEELCISLSALQRHTKPHSWFYTRNALQIAYGPNWSEIFLAFDPQPIGSGCCAQVYQAWLNPKFNSKIQKSKNVHSSSIDSWWLDFLEITGFSSLIDFVYPNTYIYSHQNFKTAIPVAVKVRHPRVDTLLRRDICILHAAAASISYVIPSIKWLSLTDCVDEFAYSMSSQINLSIECNNLERFAINFKQDKFVKFPKPIINLVRPFILVETFEEGRCVDEFIGNRRLSKKLALLGIKTILKMVFIDSFAHGDLHPGNILVQENINKNNENDIKLVFLDCGIVAPLDLESSKAIRGVFRAIALGDGDEVARLFLTHSENNCKDVPLFKEEMRHLVKRALDHTKNEHKDITGLMTSLFAALIEHKVRLDAAFSSVIIAIMVLEGLGRALDPDIDLVERAKPFLIGLK